MVLPGQALLERTPRLFPDKRDKEKSTMKIALPLTNGCLSMHFGHCEEFALVDTDGTNGSDLHVTIVDAPEHQPGLLPKWLHQQQAEVVIASGMGARAQDLFAEQGITVVVGAPPMEPERLVRDYLAGQLVPGDNVCDH